MDQEKTAATCHNITKIETISFGVKRTLTQYIY